jgi:putative hemolysin
MKYINVATFIKDSNSMQLKRMPRFIVKWIEIIILQEKMNQILTKYSEHKGLEIITKIIEELKLTIEIDGKENLPENGRCFFLSNHPFGLVDGLVLTKIVGDKYHVLKSIGNEAFMYVPHLRPFIAAVNVFGKNPKEYIAALETTYNSDVPITHFPSGEVSRIYGGKIQDCQWHKSFITKAILYNRDIVPFYIYGRNSYLFYLISLMRRVLGIKTDIELIMLPREMFRKTNRTIKVKIGKTIPHDKFDRTFSNWDWAEKVRRHVYDLESSSPNNLYF